MLIFPSQHVRFREEGCQSVSCCVSRVHASVQHPTPRSQINQYPPLPDTRMPPPPPPSLQDASLPHPESEPLDQSPPSLRVSSSPVKFIRRLRACVLSSPRAPIRRREGRERFSVPFMPSPATPCQEPLQKSLSFLFCPQRALLTSDHTRRCIPPNLCHGVCYGTPSPESHHRQRAAIAGGIHIYRRTYTHAAMQSCLLRNSPTKRKPPAAALPFSARPSLPSSHEKTAEIALIAESIPGATPVLSHTTLDTKVRVWPSPSPRHTTTAQILDYFGTKNAPGRSLAVRAPSVKLAPAHRYAPPLAM